MTASLLALVGKDLRLLLRDRSAFVFTLVFPLVIAVLFGMVFGRMAAPGPITIALVHEGSGPLADSFIGALQADPALQVDRVAGREEAIARVQSARCCAVVIVPEEFDRAAEALLTGGSMPIELLGDPSRSAELGLLQGKLMEVGFVQFMLSVGDSARLQRQTTLLRALPASDMGTSEAERAAILDLLAAAQRLAEAREERAQRRAGKQITGDAADAFPRLSAFRPVRVTQRAVVDDPARPPSSFAVTFPQGVVWGLAGCVMAFVTSLSVERNRGTLRRLCAAPLSMHMVLASKAIACFCMALLMQIMLMVLAVTAFGVRPVQPALLLPAMAAIAVAFTMVAMAVASLFQSLGGSEGAGRSVILILALLGGGSVPLVFMPPALASASAVSPFRWAIAALEGPLWRGGSMQSQLTAIGAVLLVAVIAGVIAWGALSLRRASA